MSFLVCQDLGVNTTPGWLLGLTSTSQEMVEDWNVLDIGQVKGK